MAAITTDPRGVAAQLFGIATSRFQRTSILTSSKSESLIFLKPLRSLPHSMMSTGSITAGISTFGPHRGLTVPSSGGSEACGD
jgi:hypothetical protein